MRNQNLVDDRGSGVREPQRAGEPDAAAGFLGRTGRTEAR